MMDDLAERLLANVMGWGPKEVAQHRPILQDMARYKFDEYQQFYPGMRFVESLALWLRQFQTAEERNAAFDFVCKRLVFCSVAEMAHLVGIAYPDLIRPILLRRAAADLGVSPLKVGLIAASEAFQILRRQSLFLALSDGAHTDVFRRTNPELSHEQVWHAYDMSDEKAKDMGKKLAKDLRKLLGRAPTEEEAKFRVIVLLDDFSGSGRSYLRWNDANTHLEGKLGRVLKQIQEPSGGLHAYVDHDDIYVCIVIYMAAQQAIDHLRPLLDERIGDPNRYSIEVVQPLPEFVRLKAPEDAEFLKLVDADAYYDPSVETEHTEVGGDGDVRRGFAQCALPVALSHNTPNNSVFLLWGSPDNRIRGLFPRVSRH